MGTSRRSVRPLPAHHMDDHQAAIERYHEVLNAAGVALWTVDSRLVIENLNAACAGLLGADRDALIGHSLLESVQPGWRDAVRAHFERQIAESTPQTVFEFPLTTPTGERRWVQQTAIPVVEKGHVIAIDGVLRDQPTPRASKSPPGAMEDTLRAIIENTNDGIFIKDLDGRYLLVNRASLVGGSHSVDEILGHTDAELFPADKAHLFRSTDLQVLESGQSLYFEDTVSQSGETRSYSIHKFPFRAPNGEPLGVVGISRDITELLQAQSQREHSELTFRSIIESASDNIFIKDLEGRYILANPAFALTEGWTIDHIIGHTDDELYPADRARLYRELDSQVLQTGHPLTVEASAELPAGLRTYSAHMFPFRSASGELAGVIGITRDITALKETEESLRQSEERFRAVVEDMAELVCRFAPDTTLTFVNEPYCQTFNKTREQLIGRKFLEMVPESEHAGVLQMVKDAIKTGEPYTYQHWAHMPDGELSWQEWINRPIVAPDGKVHELQAVGRDMTKRKLAEDVRSEYIRCLEIIEDLDAELSASVDFDHRLDIGIKGLKLLSRSELGAVLLLQEDHLLLARGYGDLPEWLTTPGLPSDKGIASRVLRTRRAEMVLDARKDPDYVSVQPETRAEISVPLVAGEHLVGVLVMEAADPDLFTDQVFEFVKILARRLATALENARLYQTTRKHLGELQKLYEKVSGLEQIKTQMIRIAAHDLRNPLGVAAGALELLREDLAETLPERNREHMQMLRESIERIDKISRDILTLERINAGGDMMAEQFDLRDVVRLSGEEFRKQAQQRGLNYSLEIEDSPLSIKGDRVLLRESVANLIGNAIKYTPEGGCICVRLRAEEGQAAFDVEDTGYGIPEDQQGELFQPFHRVRTKETRHVTGSGLGLHLVKSIIERAGGRMRFQSAYLKGSTFGFTLPLAGRKHRAMRSSKPTKA